jgi:hypothetical protein
MSKYPKTPKEKTCQIEKRRLEYLRQQYYERLLKEKSVI